MDAGKHVVFLSININVLFTGYRYSWQMLLHVIELLFLQSGLS